MQLAPVQPAPDYSWIADVVQSLLLVAGGLWAFYLYRKTRRSQVAVGIETNVRLAHVGEESRPAMLVGVRIQNTSGVLFRHQWSAASLFEVSKPAADGSLQMIEFASQDPLLPVYGYPSRNPQELQAGQSFFYGDPDKEGISLEPGEVVDCDLAFPLNEEPTGLLGVKIQVEGFQGKRGSKPWAWASFELADPDSMRQSQDLGFTASVTPNSGLTALLRWLWRGSER